MERENFPFELTNHAKAVVAERGIALEWIERVMIAPQRREVDLRDSALNHALGRIPEHGGRVLRVVYNENVKPWRIITAYFDRTLRDKL